MMYVAKDENDCLKFTTIVAIRKINIRILNHMNVCSHKSVLVVLTVKQ